MFAFGGFIIAHQGTNHDAETSSRGRSRRMRGPFAPALPINDDVTMSVHAETMKLLLAGLDRPVIQNAVRSMYVEYQVAVLLGERWRLVGTDWGGWDFEATTGHRLELKQAAAKQSWAQTKPSKGIFDIASRSGRYEGAAWFPGPGRFADLYVFAWHGGWDANADQRDETQWEYFVVPSSALPQQKTIGLASLKRLAVPTSAASLASGVDVVARTITPRSVVLPNASR